MSTIFDEISLGYWEKNKRTINSKSYTCYHEGYVYGDNMTSAKMIYIYRKDGLEERCSAAPENPKKAYFGFVRAACEKSPKTLAKFLDPKSSEKNRIYTEREVLGFSKTKRDSTRIKNDSCRIAVSGKFYYIANNLKICEFINTAAASVDPAERKNWFVRIYFEDDIIRRMSSKEELEEFDGEKQTYEIVLKSPSDFQDRTNGRGRKVNSRTTVKVDYEKINRLKKVIGDLGETIVFNYEFEKLKSCGKQSLAEKIEHTSKVKGDNLGYDIKSFEEDGSDLFIEVKTTKQNNEADFYLSKRERETANKKYSNGKYRVYRIYNLDPLAGTADLIIYAPPFDENEYDMQAENWRVNLKQYSSPLVLPVKD